MHNQNGTEYNKDIMESIKEFLNNSIDKALKAGVKKENIVLDPGIGFGKTFEQNVEVLRRLNELEDLGYPILLGTSRKSVLGNIVGGEPKERVEATVATTVLGIRDGVDIVRVHDVKENTQAAKIADKLYRG
jgi:Dihydropteroate synthase and related enzymes